MFTVNKKEDSIATDQNSYRKVTIKEYQHYNIQPYILGKTILFKQNEAAQSTTHGVSVNA